MSKHRYLRAARRVVMVGVCLALAAGSIGSASAQSFVYDIGVDFPEFVVLWYWDRIDFDISETDLGALLFSSYPAINGGDRSMTGSFVSGSFVADARIGDVVDDGVTGDVDDPLTLFVGDAWALRSVSASGQTQVSIKVKKKNANNPKGDKMVADAAYLGANGRLGTSIRVPSTGWSGVQWGDLYLQVDISRASSAGIYSGIEVEIVAENI